MFSFISNYFKEKKERRQTEEAIEKIIDKSLFDMKAAHDMRDIYRKGPDDEFIRYPDYESYGRQFLWEIVFMCWNDTIPPPEDSWQRIKNCPKCGRSYELLRWVMIDRKKVGYATHVNGPLSICENCNRQVQFICYSML